MPPDRLITIIGFIKRIPFPYMYVTKEIFKLIKQFSIYWLTKQAQKLNIQSWTRETSAYIKSSDLHSSISGGGTG
jgi:Golgi nucleoside diphosphatase